MTLIKCKNCGKIISDKARKCPQCNNKNFKNAKNKLHLSYSKNKLILACIILIICVGFTYSLFFKDNLNTVKESVVMVEIYDDNGDLYATGSGFCAYKSNFIVTNYHVIEDYDFIKIITDDKKEHDVTKILISSEKDDLVILKADVNLKPLKLGNSKSIKTGDEIITIGSPLGELNTVSTGIISNADNDAGIQISAPISHGSSGGVLLDKNYKIIGITYAGIDEGQNLNYAISVDYLKKLYKEYKNS